MSITTVFWLLLNNNTNAFNGLVGAQKNFLTCCNRTEQNANQLLIYIRYIIIKFSSQLVFILNMNINDIYTQEALK